MFSEQLGEMLVLLKLLNEVNCSIRGTRAQEILGHLWDMPVRSSGGELGWSMEMDSLP